MNIGDVGTPITFEMLPLYCQHASLKPIMKCFKIWDFLSQSFNPVGPLFKTSLFCQINLVF